MHTSLSCHRGHREMCRLGFPESHGENGSRDIPVELFYRFNEDLFLYLPLSLNARRRWLFISEPKR